LRRIGLTQYDESLSSRLYPGNTLSQQVLQASIVELEALLGLPWHARRQLCLRLDGGFGTDQNIDWVLSKGYQVVVKGLSGSRAAAWGRRIDHWQAIEPGRRWIGLPAQQLKFCRPTRTIAARWLDSAGKVRHALFVVTDLERPLLELAQTYDLRTRLEVDFREDKQGLLLAKRRKHSWEAQETLALLTDLARNFIVMFRTQVLAGTPLADFGLYRLTREVLNVPGRAVLDGSGYLKELQLTPTHPYAHILVDVLPKLWDL